MSFHLFIRKVSCASYSACRKDFLSGKRVRPKEIGFCRLPHLKWRLGYEIVFYCLASSGTPPHLWSRRMASSRVMPMTEPWRGWKSLTKVSGLELK